MMGQKPIRPKNADSDSISLNAISEIKLY